MIASFELVVKILGRVIRLIFKRLLSDLDDKEGHNLPEGEATVTAHPLNTESQLMVIKFIKPCRIIANIYIKTREKHLALQ